MPRSQISSHLFFLVSYIFQALVRFCFVSVHACGYKQYSLASKYSLPLGKEDLFRQVKFEKAFCKVCLNNMKGPTDFVLG